MIKKKAKKKANGKKARKKPAKKRAVRRDKDPAEVRKEISGMVKSSAKGICKAVVGHAMQGELAPAKYLFEMAQIFPGVDKSEQPAEEPDSLAKMLLEKLEPAEPRPEEKEYDEEPSQEKSPAGPSEPGETGVDEKKSEAVLV